MRGTRPLDAVHAVAPEVAWVEVDGEVVAWSPATTSLHHLDPVGALVLLLCDGMTPLRTTVAELGVALGTTEADITADVLGVVTSLVEAGVLCRVDPLAEGRGGPGRATG